MRIVPVAANRAALRRRRSGQNAILDRGLSAIIAALAILGVLAAYFLFSGNSQAQNEQAQLSAITAEVENLYGTQSNYTGLTANVIALTGALSPSWVSGTGATAAIVSVYKSDIAIAPIANPTTGLADGAYTVTLPDIPNSACALLATTNVGTNELGVSLNGTGAPTGAPKTGASPLPLPAVAEANCQKGANAMVFYFQ
jgi:hypothetical protein